MTFPLPTLPVADCAPPSATLSSTYQPDGFAESGHENAINETLRIQGMAPEEVSYWYS